MPSSRGAREIERGVDPMLLGVSLGLNVFRVRRPPPTAGLPLLMEFRCYPSEEALGLNAFDISLAPPTRPLADR